MKSLNLGAALICIGVLSACVSRNERPTITIEQPELTAIAMTQVTLAARVTDKDDNLKSIAWRQVSGPEDAVLHVSGDQAQSIDVRLPTAAGEYTFEITATDELDVYQSKRFTVVVKSLQETVFVQLDDLLLQIYEADKALIPGIQALIDFNQGGVVWRGAVGYRDAQQTQVLKTDTPFRIASISKLLSAAVTFSMIDEGLFTLDTPITALISPEDMPQGYSIEDLHVAQGIKRGGSLTIRQLLDQSTGIRDFISYLHDPLAPDTRSFIAALQGGEDDIPALWRSDLLIVDLLERGLTQNLEAMPGEKHLYGNSNTDLLAWALEKHTKKRFEQLLYERVLQPLGMDNTYMDRHEPMRGSEQIAHHYFYIPEHEEIPSELSGNHNVVALEVNTSFAWAGGGMVSTLDDLNVFMTALHQGHLVEDPQLQTEIAEHWLSEVPEEGVQEHYGLAQERFDFEGYSTTGHSGFWGTNATFVEPLAIRMVTASHQVSAESFYEFEQAAIALFHELGIKGVAPLTKDTQ
ncbi:serine hydrolase domain-containing protein [Pseudoalteromonas rubra]|uniref:serine hydrolase domain-containing protein n=1 Tax=Pseudoalteromonas rubra TaxID=43658 RepID=UPI002DB9BD92|nr:serine hydrolase [Pseudoalteromonas rubra]MEC4090327.1 serine hydrolase [Pseudoalteromonas rubra]